MHWKTPRTAPETLVVFAHQYRYSRVLAITQRLVPCSPGRSVPISHHFNYGKLSRRLSMVLPYRRVFGIRSGQNHSKPATRVL